jgi:hypothetical protein
MRPVAAHLVQLPVAADLASEHAHKLVIWAWLVDGAVGKAHRCGSQQPARAGQAVAAVQAASDVQGPAGSSGS